MTRKYRFTDKSLQLGNGLIQDLGRFVDARRRECKRRPDSEYVMHLLLSLEVVFSSIQDYHSNGLNQNLDDILDRDYLTFTEVLLLLHGLYPRYCFDLKTTSELDGADIYDHMFILNYFEGQSKVYADLSSAISAGKSSSKYGIQSDSKDGVYTEQFILWAINKGFIENTYTHTQYDIGNITKYNDDKKSISEHNIKVTLEAYENWNPALGSSKNPNAFVNDSTAFNKLKPQLKLLLKEDEAGNQIMPTKGTIAQYIRDTINSERS